MLIMQEKGNKPKWLGMQLYFDDTEKMKYYNDRTREQKY